MGLSQYQSFQTNPRVPGEKKLQGGGIVSARDRAQRFRGRADERTFTAQCIPAETTALKMLHRFHAKPFAARASRDAERWMMERIIDGKRCLPRLPCNV